MAAQDEQILKLTADRDKLKAELAAAVQDVKAAMTQMQQAARTPLTGAGQQTAGTLAAFGFSADEANAFVQQQETANVLLGKTGKSVEDLGKKAQLSKRDLNDLAGGLGLVHPQLGTIARMAITAKEALGVMFTPMGAALTAAAAALAVIIGLLQNASDELERATQGWQKFADQQERTRQAGVAVEAGVSKELGKQGKGGEAAFTAATSASKALRDMGISESTADQVAAASVGADGQELMSDQDRLLLAAAIESGAEGVKLGGKSDREQARNLRRAKKYVDRNRERLAGSARAYTRPRQRQAEAAKAGQVTEAAQVGQSLLGLSPEEAEQAARDLREMGQRDVSGGFEDEGLGLGNLAEDTNAWVNRMMGGEADVPVLGTVGRSERMNRIARAEQLKQAVGADAQRRQADNSKMEALLQELVDQGKNPPVVNVNVGGRPPVPQTGSGPKRPTS